MILKHYRTVTDYQNSQDRPSKASNIMTTTRFTNDIHLSLTKNSVPQDSPIDLFVAPNSPLVGEVSLFDFADTSELFSFGNNLMLDDPILNDPIFTFPDVNFEPATHDVVNWDSGMDGDVPLYNFDNIDAALLRNSIPDPLTNLQTKSYLYPQSTSNEQQNLPLGPTPDMQPGAADKASRLSLPKLKKSRVTRATKGKPEKSIDSSIQMPVPLSQLYPNIPLGDVATWICRSTEIRQAEWMSRRGYPKMPRPMNAFILYRKAATERAKRYGSVENHQIISKITGASWRVELDEIKDRFSQFAELEKRNHAAAFPNYKYSPNQSSRTQQPVKSKAKVKIPANVTAKATATVVDSRDSEDDELFAVPRLSDPRLYQARLESSLKQAREKSPQPVSSSSTTESSFGSRSVLFARSSAKSTRSGIKCSTRQVSQYFSERLRAKQQQIDYAEDSDSYSEDDESV